MPVGLSLTSEVLRIANKLENEGRIADAAIIQSYLEQIGSIMKSHKLVLTFTQGILQGGDPQSEELQALLHRAREHSSHARFIDNINGGDAPPLDI